MADAGDNPLLAAALGYAARGVPIFPCAPRTKKPIHDGGFHNATTDEATIRRWWAETPRANIGMPTGAVSGMFAVDIDPLKGGDESIERLEAEHGRLPDTTESHTGGGGRHKLFDHPGEFVKCSQSELASGVDIKGDGGYIVLPPSIHPNGKPYVWEASSDIADVRPVAAPAWLLDLIRKTAAGTQHGPTGAAVGEPDGNPIPQGQRNGSLARLAGGMRRMGMSRDEILAGLRAINIQRCTPPLDDREVERIAASIARYEPDAVSVALVEDHYGQMFDGQSEQTAAPATSPGPIPEHLFNVPGFVGRVMDFTLANAPYPNLGLAFCGAMALQSYLCGRKVCDDGDLRPNIYLLSLASSGAGKDYPRKVNSRVLFEIGHVSALGDKFASGQGIQDALARSAAMLFQNDEMDGVLRQINFDREAKSESIPNILLTLYTSADAMYPLRVKAGQKDAGHVDQPHLTLFGTATPQFFYESLSARMLTNGFFARLIIVDIGKRGTGQKPGPVKNLPEPILETARWWGDFQPGTRRGNLLDVHPEPRIVLPTAEATEAVESLRRQTEAEYDEAKQRNDEPACVAWSRTCENAKKLALIYACSENHQEPMIGLPAVVWATEFAMHQTRRQLYLAGTYVAENPFHAECLKLLRRLRESSDQQMGRNKLMRAMHCKLTDFEQIVGTLLTQGDIVEADIPSKTNTAKGYRIA